MQGLQIEKDVPIVMSKRMTYPYKEMDVGDSFFVPNGKMQTLSNANWRVGKKLGVKFTARQVEGGVRVWRTQ